ncbi:hypothetical protein [Adhaeribacter rhizoryzae]|uniref:Uncharacterized protein n=1 Tax=Adhaeribacter rhizoryzae TaxID=2607907 RepID=A0A5M6DT24_9BACT|nr:hypothetical protein [Adhaeribacter rhizoryzae]KAA5548555.1 hypothetical protein F0145_03280 [Adhaeribacter rhizoryzae]
MRSLVRVGLRPSRNARLSFGVQLMLVFFWIISALFMLFGDNPTNDNNFLYYLFLILALGYLCYILSQNTSVFGTQAYFEITPDYIVQKQGHFRKKIVIPLAEIAAMHIATFALKLTMKNGERHLLDLKLIRRRRNLKLIKEQLHNMALKFDIELTEGPNNRH